MKIIQLLALLLSWIFFYRLLQSKNKALPKLKATLITLLFASVIFQVSTKLYTRIDRLLFPETSHTQGVNETEHKMTHPEA